MNRLRFKRTAGLPSMKSTISESERLIHYSDYTKGRRLTYAEIAEMGYVQVRRGSSGQARAASKNLPASSSVSGLCPCLCTRGGEAAPTGFRDTAPHRPPLHHRGPSPARPPHVPYTPLRAHAARLH